MNSPTNATRARTLKLLRLALPEEGQTEYRLVPDEDYVFIRNMGLLPLLHQHQDQVEMSQRMRERLHGGQAAMARRNLHTSMIAVRIQTLLASQGIRSLVYKGAALAVLNTGSVGGRMFSDIDLLVAPADIQDAHELLRAHGWWQKDFDLPGADTWLFPVTRRITCESTFRSNEHASVDLHWRLDPTQANLRLSFEQVWQERLTLNLHGMGLATLSVPHAALLCAVHATRERWQVWKQMVDWLQLQQQLSDRSAFVDMAREVGALSALGVAAVLEAGIRGDELSSAQQKLFDSVVSQRIIGGALGEATSKVGIWHGTRWRWQVADTLPAACTAAGMPLVRRSMKLALSTANRLLLR